MARRKKPDGETLEQAEVRHILETIADTATRSEKVSWDRKMDNMVKLLAKLRPIEEQLLDLMVQKAPILDEVQALRKEMVKECVHPYTHLTFNDNDETIVCKFCERKFAIREMLSKENEDE
jgi:hypothetical protein